MLGSATDALFEGARECISQIIDFDPKIFTHGKILGWFIEDISESGTNPRLFHADPKGMMRTFC